MGDVTLQSGGVGGSGPAVLAADQGQVAELEVRGQFFGGEGAGQLRLADRLLPAAGGAALGGGAARRARSGEGRAG
ncbi:hypothetical protein AB0K48_32150 [Nonomuraea sp. NPDC055795]